MKTFLFILLLFLCSNRLIAQPSMDHYFTSILIDWKTDTTNPYRFLHDSLEYGFLGFYESKDFNYKTVKDFITDSLDSQPDSAGFFDFKILMGFKPIYFCDPIKPIQCHNPTVGLYSSTGTDRITRRGTMIEYYSKSAYLNSETDFILIMVMRNKFSKENKMIVVRDSNGPQRYHLTIKIDFFNFNTIPEISYFDFVDRNSKFFPTKIVDKSTGNSYHKFIYKTISTT